MDDEDYVPPLSPGDNSSVASDAEMDSAVDPRATARKRTRIAREKVDKDDVWRGVMGTVTGRAVMWELLGKCGTFSFPSAVTPAGIPDPVTHMFHLGRQSVGRAIYEMLACLDRELLLQMHDEHDAGFKRTNKRVVLK